MARRIMDKETGNNENKTEDTLFELLELVAPDDGAPGASSAAAETAAQTKDDTAVDEDDDAYDDGVYDDGAYDDDDTDDEDDFDDEDDEDDEDDFDDGDDADDGDEDELPIIDGKRVERRKKPRVKKDPAFDLTHPDYTLTLTKGLTNEVVRRRYYPHNRAIATFVFSFLIFVAAVCFMVYSVIYMIGNERLKRSQEAQIGQLTREIESLMAKNGELSSTVTHLSRSVNRTLEDHRVEAQAFEQALVPKGFPLSAFVPMEVIRTAEDNVFGDLQAGEADDEEENAGAADSADTGDTAGEGDTANEGDADRLIPTAVFEAEQGSHVLAAGGGVVTRITADASGGLVLTIDHRNGYVTSYYNAGSALVNAGDSVWRGDELFLIGEENTLLAFRVRMNDTWLDPEEVIELGG